MRPSFFAYLLRRLLRYRSILKRLEGVEDQWMKNSLVVALGGFTTRTRYNSRFSKSQRILNGPKLSKFVCCSQDYAFLLSANTVIKATTLTPLLFFLLSVRARNALLIKAGRSVCVCVGGGGGRLSHAWFQRQQISLVFFTYLLTIIMVFVIIASTPF